MTRPLCDNTIFGQLQGWAILLRFLSVISAKQRPWSVRQQCLCAGPGMAPRLSFLPCSKSKLPAPWRQLGLLTRSLHAQAGCRPGRLSGHSYSITRHGGAAEAPTAALLNWSQSQYWEVNYSEHVLLDPTLWPVKSVQVHTAGRYTNITMQKGKAKAARSLNTM